MLLWIALAHAEPVAAYGACCRAMGGGACPSTLDATGPGTEAVPVGGRLTLQGLWRLDCGRGPTFDAAASRPVDVAPVGGVVFGTLSASAAACFDAACRLPPSLCLRHEGDRARVTGCETREEGTAAEWAVPGMTPYTPVVVLGRVVKALPVQAAPARAGAPSAGVATSVVVRGGGAGPAPTSPGGAFFGVPGVATVTPTPGTDLSVPPPPPLPCPVPPHEAQAGSRAEVDAGNASELGGDWAQALVRYRGAIAANPCNAVAWADLGDALLTLGRPSGARLALGAATALMPTHYGAWTDLGRAEEAEGRKADAREAYARALAQRPGHPAAEEGLARTSR